ncbi:acyl-CoA 6-desaturase isoform X2 [Microcaecilia unicolor]|uniref:Acyl-CoA 6-desaturase isoform X2 n=1 Tax=Microcaecilia unicolor TaxID=1415580 RepID=A0A6P7Y2H3_9AMPH|nr:acyl-CoA 6-desaturase isoform X2 [Microcaecilia unicolor]
MGKGGENGECEKPVALYSWEEIQKHNVKTDQWLVIERKVYNISEWVRRHPGGARVIGHYAGEDATDPFRAFHPDYQFVQKFLKPLLIGELAPEEPSQDRDKNAQQIEDFRALRKTAEDMALFNGDPVFFSLYLGHILLLEVLAWFTLWYFGTGLISTMITIILLTTSQAQAGWLQHDFGHLSVFKKSSWNHVVHKFVIGHLKGASANWWNHRHFQHHAKPNIFRKDPDVNMLHVFVLGDTQPIEYGKKKLKYLPYNYQHEYFFLIGPPLLIPIYFTIQIIKTMIDRRDWVDLIWSFSYYIRYFYTFVPFYGVLGSLVFLNTIRFFESHWFVWVTQMNHIAMEIDKEKYRDWLSCQPVSHNATSQLPQDCPPGEISVQQIWCEL